MFDIERKKFSYLISMEKKNIDIFIYAYISHARLSICENSFSVIESIRNAIDASHVDASNNETTTTGNEMIAFVFVIFLHHFVHFTASDQMVNILNWKFEVLFLKSFSSRPFSDPFSDHTTHKLERAQAAGATIECHYVTTQDGYILRLYHIPPAPNTSTGTREVNTIFFMHGLQSSSLDYVIYPNISLGEYWTRVWLWSFPFLLRSFSSFGFVFVWELIFFGEIERIRYTSKSIIKQILRYI